MEGTVPLHAIAPDARSLLLHAARTAGAVRTAGGDVQLIARLRAMDAAPYLLLTDKATVCQVDGATVPTADIVAALRARVAAGDLQRLLPDVFACVSIMAAWDRLFRELGIYDGNIYFESEDAVGALLASLDADVPEAGMHGTLDELQALQLIYRFPIALKFGPGLGGASQCRLNGWGRRLDALMAPAPAGVEHRRCWHLAIRRHIRAHASSYRAVVADLRAATDDAPARNGSALEPLLVPVLI